MGSRVVEALAPLLMTLSALVAQAAGPPTGFQSQIPPVESPNGTFVAEYYVGDAAADRQLWIRSKVNPDDAALLYEYPRNAEVLFSPDENWLVVNDAAGSNLEYTVLFKHEKGALFSRVTNVDVSESAWRLLRKENQVKRPLDLAHMYAAALRWAPDSGSFLLSLSGHTDINHRVDGWLCVFNVKAFRSTSDLSLMNRGAVHIKH